jgi:hypothetical protein
MEANDKDLRDQFALAIAKSIIELQLFAFDEVAQIAYRVADDLLKEREKLDAIESMREQMKDLNHVQVHEYPFDKNEHSGLRKIYPLEFSPTGELRLGEQIVVEEIKIDPPSEFETPFG